MKNVPKKTAVWYSEHSVLLTRSLAAWTLTTHDPSLTMWQIFPKESSTSRISSFDEGMGTMLHCGFRRQKKFTLNFQVIILYSTVTKDNIMTWSWCEMCSIVSYNIILPLRIKLAQNPHHLHCSWTDLLIVIIQKLTCLQCGKVAKQLNSAYLTEKKNYEGKNCIPGEILTYTSSIIYLIIDGLLEFHPSVVKLQLGKKIKTKEIQNLPFSSGLIWCYRIIW